LTAAPAAAEFSALTEFFQSASRDECGEFDSLEVLMEVIDGFVGLIQAVEIRSRLSLSCLGRETLPLLAKHLFDAIYWYARKASSKLDPSKKDAETRFVLSLIPNRDVRRRFWELAAEQPISLPFVRRASLLFAMLFTDASAIDWSEVLSESRLRLLVPSRFECAPLPTWNIELPVLFQQLAKSVPLDDQSTDRGLCLLSNTVVSLGEKSGSLVRLDGLLNRLCYGVILILVISGTKASAIQMICANPVFHLWYLPSVYINSDGNEDVGFQGFAPLALNRDRLERYVDSLVTGDWLSRP
jgi:hypothetical protein